MNTGLDRVDSFQTARKYSLRFDLDGNWIYDHLHYVSGRAVPSDLDIETYLVYHADNVHVDQNQCARILQSGLIFTVTDNFWTFLSDSFMKNHCQN